MPAGVPPSEEDTQEYQVVAGPYPRAPATTPSPAASAGLEPPMQSAGTYPGTWPGRPGAATHPAQQSHRPARYGTSVMAVAAAIVLLIFGLLATLVGGAGLAMDDLLDELVRVARDTDLELKGRALRSLLSATSWVVLVVGILHLVSALAVFAHRNLGRFIGLALALGGTLIGTYAVAQILALGPQAALNTPLAAAAVVAAGYGLALFGLIAGGGHFRRNDHAD